MNNCLLDLKSLNNINPSRCELERLVEESVAMAQVYAPDAQITYDAQGEIYIDENKLCACLVNIIKNAIEAQADKVEIFARPDKISITNNGSKIENPEEIFNEGFTTKPTGSGLGLYICARNLEMQEAKLRLADSGGFEIILPNQ
jgi:signal transduction histidine kinase